MARKKHTGRRRVQKTKRRPRVTGMAVGSIVAARLLGSASAPGRKVIVEIGKPRKTRGQDDFFCPYRIRGLGDDVVRAAYGVDTIQALQLAMHAVGSVLARHRDLRFLDNENLGFPEPGDMQLLREAKERLAKSPPE